jgi:hypothetical protein
MLRHDLLNRAGVGDIQLCGDCSDLPGQRRCAGDVEITDDDTGSGGSKTPHDRCANALRSARDKSAASIQPSEGQGTGGRHP